MQQAILSAFCFADNYYIHIHSGQKERELKLKKKKKPRDKCVEHVIFIFSKCSITNGNVSTNETLHVTHNMRPTGLGRLIHKTSPVGKVT